MQCNIVIKPDVQGKYKFEGRKWCSRQEKEILMHILLISLETRNNLKIFGSSLSHINEQI